MVQTISQSCESRDSFVHWIKHCLLLKKNVVWKLRNTKSFSGRKNPLFRNKTYTYLNFHHKRACWHSWPRVLQILKWKCTIKEILHKKNFWKNLIFSIVMWCGIVDFGRRGLLMHQTDLRATSREPLEVEVPCAVSQGPVFDILSLGLFHSTTRHYYWRYEICPKILWRIPLNTNNGNQRDTKPWSRESNWLRAECLVGK